MPKKKEYEIGYGKPPTATQFKKGHSGNPAGRPSGTRNLNTDVLQEMGETILVKEGGKQIKISKQRAMVKALVAKALKGDVRAATKLVELQDRAQLAREREKAANAPELSSIDQEILNAFTERLLEESSQPPLSGVQNHED